MTAAWVTATCIVVYGALLAALPGLSRPDILFAVTVTDEVRRSALARSAIVRYRMNIVAGTAAAIALALLAASPRVATLAPLVQILIALAAWTSARRTILPYAAPPQTSRTAALAVRDVSFPGGIIGACGPLLILVAAAWFLHVNWDRIPDQFATHWDGTGAPNRWAIKSVRSVYGMIVFGGALAAAMLVQTAWLVRRTRQVATTGTAAVAEARVKRVWIWQSLGGAYLTAALCSYFATRSAIAADDRLGLGAWVLLGLIVASAAGVMLWMIRMGQGGHRLAAAASSRTTDGPHGDATPDSAWKAGLIYYNPADPAVFVEKRVGLGWTLNFGNVWAWVFLVLALAVPMLIVRLPH
jgi:uncharacterized membrane protein